MKSQKNGYYSFDQKYLDFFADPKDPNFDPIEKLTCFSAPITDSTILKLTLQEAYTNLIHPVQKNMIYQNKQPEGVRYLKFYFLRSLVSLFSEVFK